MIQLLENARKLCLVVISAGLMLLLQLLAPIKCNAAPVLNYDSIIRLHQINHHDPASVVVALSLAKELIDDNHYVSIRLAKEALTIAADYRDTSGMADAHYFLANIYVNYTLDYIQGLDELKKSLELTQPKNWTRRVEINRLIAFVSKTHGETEESIAHYKKAIAIADSHGDRDMQAELLSYLGDAYEVKGDLPLAISCYQQVKLMYDNGELKVNSPSVLFTVASVDLYAGDTASTIQAYREFVRIFDEESNRRWQAYTCFRLAELLWAIDSTDQAWIESAKGLELSNRYGLVKEKSDNLRLLIELANERSDYRNGLLFTNQLKEIEDSIFNAEKVKLFSNIRAELDLVRKNKEIELLKAEKMLGEARSRSSEIIAIVVVCCLLFLLGIALYLWRRKKVESKRLDFEVKMRTEMLSEALESLETEHRSTLRLQSMIQGAQISPHFIFNSLNSMQFYILDKKVQPALNYLSKFSTLLRTIQNNAKLATISLEEEILFIDEYLKLEQERFSGKFTYEIVVADELEEDERIPPLLIQPLVEHTVVHGLRNLEEHGKLKIEFELQNDRVVCTITDNGNGRKAAEINKRLRSSGSEEILGLTASYNRAKVLSRLYDRQFELDISDISGSDNEIVGTQIRITFPLLLEDAIASPATGDLNLA